MRDRHRMEEHEVLPYTLFRWKYNRRHVLMNDPIYLFLYKADIPSRVSGYAYLVCSVRVCAPIQKQLNDLQMTLLSGDDDGGGSIL